jgi:mono/diheme cytochrome c family protein
LSIRCKTGFRLAGLTAGFVALSFGTAPAATSSEPGTVAGITAQGWSPTQQHDFYTIDQGSRIIPIIWFNALMRADGKGLFAADGLARFGYLPNPPSPLPVGFMVAADTADHGGRKTLAMNCAACHTREIVVDGRPIRIDGGPAIADFYSFLADLNAAVQAILLTGGDFEGFAKRVLGSTYTARAAEHLRADVTDWYADYGPFIKSALPPERKWGPTRLDAFGMIFDRVSGLDLGIEANIRRADAPVRYPFLWNAPFQDATQWNGAVPNGLYTLGIGRNLGEVYGVFGRFSPHRKTPWPPMVRPWVVFNGEENSAQFRNLQKLEQLVAALKPPPYPLPIDTACKDNGTACKDKGQDLFVQNCERCHAPHPSDRIMVPGIWKTPVLPAGTDPRMFDNAKTTTKGTGVLLGVGFPQWSGLGELADDAPAVGLLGNAVGNTLLQELAKLKPKNGVLEAVLLDLFDLVRKPPRSTTRLAGIPSLIDDPSVPEISPKKFAEDTLRNLYQQAPTEPGATASYEARVLNGIWAAAPYLHNGSVPTLWALLQKPEDRPKQFMLGSNKFDAKNVGLVTDESPFGYLYRVSSCDGPDNGDGNCGHLWGTELQDDEKWALIEYLKTY